MSTSTASVMLAEIGAELRQSMRAPEFLLPTVALPFVFYSIFGVMLARGGNTSAYLLATYGVFAVMGPSLFGFGASVANEREKGWLLVRRVSPAPGGGYIVAKLIATLVFSCIALMPVYLAAGFLANVSLTSGGWLALLGSHLLAVVPFSFMGLAIGLTFSSGAAVAVANLAFLGLAILGGLWFPIRMFPEVLQTLAPGLPSYHLAGISLNVVGSNIGPSAASHAAAVALISLAVAALAGWRWSAQSQ